MKVIINGKNITKIIVATAVTVAVAFAVAATVFFGSKLRGNKNIGQIVTFINPQGNMYMSGGSELEFTVGAYSEAKLTAVFCGQNIELVKGDNAYGEYSVFRGRVVLPPETDTVQSLGSICIQAQLAGKTENYSGGNIFINSKVSGTLPTQSVTEGTTEAIADANAGIQKKYTPYSYNGVQGNSNFAVVKSENAETRPLSGVFYNPSYTALPKGTVDIITGESSYTNQDGDTFDMYNLLSGRRIDKKDVDVVTAGYNVPLNEIKCIGSSSADGFDIVLSMSWSVPFSVSLCNQSYYSGYEGKTFNVSNFTADAVDIVFCHTYSASGNPDIGNNPIISSADWKDSGNNTRTLHCTLRKQGGFYGYSTRYDENGNLVIHFNKGVNALQNMKIVLDPGHGGKDSGAKGRGGTVYESHQTMKIAGYLSNYLSQSGAYVYMTRTDDSYHSLEERRELTEKIQPDMFISVHLNSSENLDRSGTGTFYYNAFSNKLAGCIHSRLYSAFSTSCYQNNPQMLRNLDGGNNFYPFYVTRTSCCPSVLIETGFISHSYECAFLIDDAYQQVFAYAIYSGIVDYVSSNP